MDTTLRNMHAGDTDWERLEALLDRLIDAEPSGRSELLSQLEAKDARLAERARSLLALALDETVFPTRLDRAAPDLFAALANEDVQVHLGEKLGPYRIVELIRRGGMGAVFRGEREDGSYDQVVAIKLIPSPVASAGARALFDRERRHLARLDHPNIARIIDAGVTSADTPYYVMEYVAGIPIDQFLGERSSADVFAYFLQVCDAVIYCHTSMVVHGDIKPANILVADDRVRLLDFGIGQLLDESTRSRDDPALRAFSPGFAAPEQLEGQAATILSDVYSLGVLLQRLLPPETSMRNDVEAIIGRCLAAVPSQRYESVSALRDDIRNYLGKYPVAAREATVSYRAGRFVLRNKLLVGTTAGALAALALGLAVALWQYSEARTQALRAGHVKSFLTSLFEQADPLAAGEKDVTLRQVVDDAASRIDAELADLPDVRAEVTQLIGTAYFGIGEYDNAFALHAQALRLRRSTLDPPHADLASAYNKLGADYTQRGEYTEAVRQHYEAIDQLDALGLGLSEAAWASWTHLGQALVNIDPPAATNAMIRAHEINLAVRPDDPAAVARSLGNIASGYRAERKIAESADHHEQALAVAEANNERLAPEILAIRCNLALDYGTLGLHAKARDAQHLCNAMTVERFGEDHPANVANLNNLGALHIRMGLLDEAYLVYQKALRIAEDKLPPMALDRMATEINYSVVLWHSGQAGEAEPRLRDLLVRAEQSFGAAHPAAGRVRSLLGRLVLERGAAKLAEALIEDSLEGLTPYWRSDALLWLAEAKLALDKTGQARQLARGSLVLRESIPHYTDWQLAEARFVLARASGDDARLDASRRQFARALPPEHFRRAVPATVGSAATR